MNDNTIPLKSSKVRIAGWVSSILGGIIALLVDSLMISPEIKKLLVIITPAISILFGTLLTYFYIRINNANSERILKSEIDRARRDLEVISANPRTSEGHKQKAVNHLEKLEGLNISVKSRKIENIRILTNENETSTYEVENDIED